MSGHCAHCHPDCAGVGGVWDHTAQPQPREGGERTAYLVWMDGHCPLCAAETGNHDVCHATVKRVMKDGKHALDRAIIEAGADAELGRWMRRQLSGRRKTLRIAEIAEQVDRIDAWEGWRR